MAHATRTTDWAAQHASPITAEELDDLIALTLDLDLVQDKSTKRISLEGAPHCLYIYPQASHSIAVALRGRLQTLKARLEWPGIEE